MGSEMFILVSGEQGRLPFRSCHTILALKVSIHSRKAKKGTFVRLFRFFSL